MSLLTDAELARVEALLLYGIREFYIIHHQCQNCDYKDWQELEQKIQQLEETYLSDPDLIAEMEADAASSWLDIKAA